MRSIENIVLVIIDQLRADYARFFSKCRERLPHIAVCDTNSIPSSTEAMHANISTGEPPSVHGLISKRAKDAKDGLAQFDDKLASNELSSLARLAKNYGFEAYLLGGKPETVRVMGLPRDCALRLHYDRALELFKMDGARSEQFSDIEDVLGQAEYRRVPQENLDAALLRISDKIMAKRSGKSFFAIMLPSIDAIGHKYGPDSAEIRRQLSFLDEQISRVIYCFSDDTAFIVTGDHGCRPTTRYVIESDEADPREVVVYGLFGNNLEFHAEHSLGSENGLDDVQYDGGILRIWFREGVNELSQQDRIFLSGYGDICGKGSSDLSDRLKQIYLRSLHANIGDATVVAHEDVTFCKSKWIDKRVLTEAIQKHKTIERKDLPAAEHGTHHPADSTVFIISNCITGSNTLNSIEIKAIVEDILRNRSIYLPK